MTFRPLPADAGPATFADTGILPPWNELPDGFKRELAALGRWACTLDRAHERCRRRDCRNDGMCLADAPSRCCEGRPDERVSHWITGMWLVASLGLEVDPDAEPAGGG